MQNLITQKVKLSNSFSLIGLFFLLSTNAFTQINIATRIGLSTFTEVQLEAAYPLPQNYFLYGNVAYTFRGFNLVPSGCRPFFPPITYDDNKTGFSLKFGLSKSISKTKKGKTKDINGTIALVYRRIQGNLNTNLDGCGDRYDFNANDFGIYFYRDRSFSRTISFYWGFALLYSIQKQTPIPNSLDIEVEVKNQIRPILDIGVRLSIWTKKPSE